MKPQESDEVEIVSSIEIEDTFSTTSLSDDEDVMWPEVHEAESGFPVLAEAFSHIDSFPHWGLNE